MIIAFVIIFLILILLWSIYLPFYKEKKVVLIPNEDKCFSKDCHSIVIRSGNDRAILFIHGFPTTPYMYKDVAYYTNENNYDVFAPLIPTFGANYKDFVKTNFPSWFDYIDTYYQSLRKEYNEVFVVGVSMGGAITLKLAEIHSGTTLEMNGIAVLSAPVTYNSFIRDRIMTNPLGYLARILKLFIPYIGAKPCTHIALNNDGDENWHGYKGIFLRQGVSLMYNFKLLRNNLGKIKVPMIAIHERSDKTVPFKNLEIIKNETNCKSEFHETMMGDELIHTHHALLSYNSTRIPLMDKILRFFNSLK